MEPTGRPSAHATTTWPASWIAVLRRSSIVIWLSPSAPQPGGGWSRDHALSLAYFSKISRLYSACTAFREICPFRSLAIFRRSGSVGARDFRLNLAKSFLAGPEVLPIRMSKNPIVSSRIIFIKRSRGVGLVHRFWVQLSERMTSVAASRDQFLEAHVVG